MRKIIHKAIFAWDFDKEEKWLNEMAAKGLCLISVGFCKYEFEDCEPGEYRICMQLLDKVPSHPESQKYIEFLEATGAEQVGAYTRWVYFRKKSIDGEFALFSDNASRIKYFSRVIRLLALITVINLGFAVMATAYESRTNYLGLINLALGIWGSIGTIKLIKKQKKMQRESRLFE